MSLREKDGATMRPVNSGSVAQPTGQAEMEGGKNATTPVAAGFAFADTSEHKSSCTKGRSHAELWAFPAPLRVP